MKSLELVVKHFNPLVANSNLNGLSAVVLYNNISILRKKQEERNKIKVKRLLSLF
jgi:hypothetical protein